MQSESTNNQIVMESHTNRSKSGGKPASKKSQSICRAKPRTKRYTPFHVALPRPGLAHQLSITEPTLKSKACLKCLYFTKNNP